MQSVCLPSRRSINAELKLYLHKFHIYFRLLEFLPSLNMVEDIADRLDDLICAWDKVVGTDLDTIVLLLLGKIF